jgi:transcriptional regulator with XRE-family HTH domain
MKKTLAITFAARLKSVRGGRSQSEMATLLDMKQPMYARYESGVTLPSAEVICRICDATGESADFLLGRSSTSMSALRTQRLGGLAKPGRNAEAS